MEHSLYRRVGVSDVGAFLTQLPFKENAFLERIVRVPSVPAETGGAGQM
jgi:hypothetical protein